MMQKLKSFFAVIKKSIKQRPVIAAIPAAIIGVVAAAAVTVITIKYFKQGKAEKLFSSMSFYESFSAVPVSTVSSEEYEVSSEAPVIQPIQKQVSYKGKNINVATVEVAKSNSKEDSENGNYVAEKPEPTAQAVSGITIESSKGSAGKYLYGIDVSSHNEEIDWAKVKQSGVQFAMIRCGYRGYLTGKIVMDACFEYNIESAYKNGIAVGVYFYSTATNETEAMEEAAYVVELVKSKAANGIKISYPIAYDFEEFYNTDNRSRAKTLQKAQISSNAAAFLDFIKSSGYTPMLYAGKNPMKNYFEPYLASRYNFWLANYANATEYEGKFFMWQYTSSGSVGGIVNSVDLNVCGFENSDNLQRFSICKEQGTIAYNKPDISSGVAFSLKAGEIYLYRNTYNSEFKELKIDDKYCYVLTADLIAPFNSPEYKYKTSADEDTYKYPIDEDDYKTGVIISKETDLDVRGVWDDWLEIKYGGKIYYIKADKLVVTDSQSTSDITPSSDTSYASSSDNSTDDTSSDDTSSDTSSAGNSSEDSIS